jgi:capsule polysaccharide export protein KpsE/RkpR
MREREPKNPAGLSDLEAPIMVGEEAGEFAGSEPAPDAGEARQHAIATLRLLWERRQFLGRTTGVGLLLSALIAFVVPVHYQSTARLMPPDNQSGSGLAMAAAALSGGAAGSGGMAGMAGELLGLRSTSDLLVGVLGSRTEEDKLVQEFDLRKVYGVRGMEDARRKLSAWTDVSVDRKSQIITITVTDKSPQRAAAIAQAYVEELNRTLADVSTSSARRERIFLEERLRAVSADLEAAEKEFSQFASKNTAVDIKEQGKAMFEAAATLQGQLIAARSELEGLRQIYTDGNVRVRSAQARVTELEDELKKVGGENANATLDKSGQSDVLYPSIRQLPILGVTYADLYRKTKVQEAVFETLTQEYELARVQEAKEIPSIKVLDSPTIPERKSFPPRTLITLLGTVFALSCAVTWVLARRKWEGMDPADPGKILAQEVFGSVMAAMPWASRNGDASRTESPGTGGLGNRTGVEKETDK